MANSLWSALEMGDIREVTYLLADESNKDFLDERDEYGRTPLMVAATLSDSALFHILVEQGAPLDRGDNNGMTPLMHAIINQNESIVEFLAKHSKTNINRQDASGRTALSIAAMTGNLAAVEELIRNKADVSIVDNQAISPLLAAASVGAFDIVKTLAKNGAILITKKDSDEFDPILFYAVQYNRPDILKQFINAKVNLYQVNESGDSLLVAAARYGAEDTYKLLLKHINTNDEQFLAANKYNADTPLIAAAMHGQQKMVEFLLNQGADIHAKNAWGKTALFTAMESGDIETAQLLVNNGADVNITVDGKTLHQVAEEYALIDMLAVLPPPNTPPQKTVYANVDPIEARTHYANVDLSNDVNVNSSAKMFKVLGVKNLNEKTATPLIVETKAPEKNVMPAQQVVKEPDKVNKPEEPGSSSFKRR